ncbi:deoxyribodipyrimidine photo-lyase-like [Glandiceps talaboti]
MNGSEERALRRELLHGKLSIDEYFCYILSIFGDAVVQRDFPAVLADLGCSNETLGNELCSAYTQYFQSHSGNSTSSLHRSDDTLGSDCDLELVKALSLGEVSWHESNGETRATQLEAMSYADKLRPAATKSQHEHVIYPSQENSLMASSNDYVLLQDMVNHVNHECTERDGMQRPVEKAKLENDSKRPNRRKRTRRNGKNLTVERPLLSKPVIVLFRRDLRTYDNPALKFAIEKDAPIIPVFIWSKTEEATNFAVGGATSYWLHQTLLTLDLNLQLKYSSRIIFRKATSTLQEIRRLAKETGARTVCMNAVYEPWLAKRDIEIEKCLKHNGIDIIIFHSYLLHEPNSITVESTGLRGIGSVSHFMKCSKRSSVEPLGDLIDAPGVIPLPGSWPTSMALEELELAKMPRRRDGTVIDWAANIRSTWTFGEDGGYKALQEFLRNGVYKYEKESGRADQPNTSRISPYLHWGEISPRTILAESFKTKSPKFRRKLAWRDMAYWLLSLFPEMASEPMRPHYQFQRWSRNKDHLKAWQKGNTGYPLVDAAMRELWLTGWMNNYMRHVVASFLISYLHLHWIEGYKWFQDTLLDADVAINAMMWQNGGMSGLDQWNFVMHPVDAAMTCDPCGDYVRKWIPELCDLPDEYIHTPWKCPSSQLRRAGVELGRNYPTRIIVDLEAAREQSLQDVVEIRKMCEAELVDPKTGNDLVPIPLANSTLMLPVITRREFKYKSANPDSKGNPHSAVLKGYRSRKRDEAIAYANQREFLASTMNEYVQRQQRLQLADL